MEFKDICEYRHSLRLSFVRLDVSPSIFIFRFGEIPYTLCGIPTGRSLVKTSEGSKVLVALAFLRPLRCQGIRRMEEVVDVARRRRGNLHYI